jgi:hypothetical protein
MHKISTFSPIFFFLSVFFLSCNPRNSQIESDQAVSVSAYCLSNPEHSYELYIPSGSRKCKKLPFLIILDPHGKGKSALELFIPAAEKYKFILAASNLIKNNLPDFVPRIQELREDITNKYPVNDQLVIAGFSGGARMAMNYAQFHQVEGVITCGALASPEQISAIGSTVYAISGMADFNFIESAQYLFRPDNAPKNLRIEFTRDLHQWPDSLQLSRLVGYIFFENSFETQKCLDFKSLMNHFLKDEEKKSRDLLESGDYISAYLEINNLAYVDIFHNSPEFIKLYNSSNYANKLNEQLNMLKESIRFELQTRETYYKQLAVKDSIWWKHEINTLNDQIKKSKSPYSALAYQRIKAFLGIMCYSLTDNALQHHDLPTASRLLPVYAYLEPHNPDMFYFRALYSKTTGNNVNEIKYYLQKAIDAGFSDQEKIEALREGF